MINKIGRTLRKAHRYLTPVFILVTILYMFVFKVPILERIQKVLMLTMAASGAFLFFQIYYNKNKAKKRKPQK
jgi:Ca2+/Na+ antiporter